MRKKITTAVCGALSALLLVFAVMTVCSFLGSAATHRMPAIFGLSVARIESGSMSASGFAVGDHVLVRLPRAGEPGAGDIICYYRDKNTRVPQSADELTGNTEIVFHEIIGVTGGEAAEYVTKGSSNGAPDAFPVPFAAVAGLYVETAGGVTGFFNFILGRYAIAFWLILCGVALAALGVFDLAKVFARSDSVRRLVSGKTPLLSGRVLEQNIYREIGKTQRGKLLNGVETEFRPLASQLLRGSIEGAEGKRCLRVDAAALVCAWERNSPVLREQYIASLPDGVRSLDRFADANECIAKLRESRFAAVCGTLPLALFGVLALIVEASVSARPNWAFGGVLIALAVVAAAYGAFVLVRCFLLTNAARTYFDQVCPLPDCYDIYVHMCNYTEDEFADKHREVRRRLFGVPRENDATVGVMPEMAATAETVTFAPPKAAATIDENYGALSVEHKEFYESLKRYAVGKPGATLTETRSCENVKIGKRLILRLKIRRGTTVAIFPLENEALKDYIEESGRASVRVKPTEVRVRDVVGYRTAVNMVDLACMQLEKEKEELKERRRLARKAAREKRRTQEPADVRS